MTLTNGHYISPSKGLISVQNIISEIAGFVHKSPESFYQLVIGTDSRTKKINGKAEIDFVTAIVIHRKGNGARYFWRKQKKYMDPILRDKIYTETMISLTTAEKLVPSLREAISSSNYGLEIHIDVGMFGPTREMIKEVVGMVSGLGYIAKTKPESWGASCVADKHT